MTADGNEPPPVPFEALAQVLTEDSEHVARLIGQHVDDGGFCHACAPVGARVPVRWPCTPRQLARRALEIQHQRRRPAGPTTTPGGSP